MYQQWLLGLWALFIGLVLVGPVRADDEKDLVAAFTEAQKLLAASKFKEATPLYEKLLRLSVRLYGEKHQDTATILHCLGLTYSIHGNVAEAMPHFQRSLKIREELYGKEDPRIVDTVSMLGSMYLGVGKFAEAELLGKRGLAIMEKVYPKDHPEVATALNDLANMYLLQAKNAEAEPLFKRSLAIRENSPGEMNLPLSETLNNLGDLYTAQGKYAAAKPLLLRSLNMREKALDMEHNLVGGTVGSLANLFMAQGKYADSELHFKRYLSISVKVYGEHHTEVAGALSGLALLYIDQARYAEAEKFNLRSLAILETVLGKDHPDVAASLTNMARLYAAQGKNAEAETFSVRALDLLEKVHGKDHPAITLVLHNMAHTYAEQAQYGDSAKVLTRVRENTRIFLLRELPSMSASEQRSFLRIHETTRFSVALSLGYRSASDAVIVESSAGWLLNGKAISLEAQTIRSRLEREVVDEDGRAALRELQAIRSQESALALQAADPKKTDIAKQREQLEVRRRELEKKLAQQSGTAAKLANPWVDLAEVRKKIPADGVLIDIARFRPHRFGAKDGEKKWDDARYVAWVIPAKGPIRIVDLGEADKIDAATKSAREVIEEATARLRNKEKESKVEADAFEKLAAVSKLVFEPLKPHLGEVKKLILSPDGDLWLLPWRHCRRARNVI